MKEVKMTDKDNQPQQNDDLACRQEKWKKTERICYYIAFALMIVYSVLSIIYKYTHFSSVAYYVLVGVLSVLMVVDVTILCISWCKLNRINKQLFPKQENDHADSDK